MQFHGFELVVRSGNMADVIIYEKKERRHVSLRWANACSPRFLLLFQYHVHPVKGAPSLRNADFWEKIELWVFISESCSNTYSIRKCIASAKKDSISDSKPLDILPNCIIPAKNAKKRVLWVFRNCYSFLPSFKEYLVMNDRISSLP